MTRCCLGTACTSGTVLGHAIRPDREVDVVETACVAVETLLELESTIRSEKWIERTTGRVHRRRLHIAEAKCRFEGVHKLCNIHFHYAESKAPKSRSRKFQAVKPRA